MSFHSSTPNIDELLQRLETILLQAWSETGFGHIEVSSERFKEDKIRVILQGSTHYRYVITNQEVEQKMNGSEQQSPWVQTQGTQSSSRL